MRVVEPPKCEECGSPMQFKETRVDFHTSALGRHREYVTWTCPAEPSHGDLTTEVPGGS